MICCCWKTSQFFRYATRKVGLEFFNPLSCFWQFKLWIRTLIVFGTRARAQNFTMDPRYCSGQIRLQRNGEASSNLAGGSYGGEGLMILIIQWYVRSPHRGSNPLVLAMNDCITSVAPSGCHFHDFKATLVTGYERSATASVQVFKLY